MQNNQIKSESAPEPRGEGAWLGLLVACVLNAGCASDIKKSADGITDPNERGAMYIATALVISAIIRRVINK